MDDLLLGSQRYLLQYGVFVALAVFAWFRGDAPERQLAAVFLAAIAFEFVHHGVTEPGTSEQVEIAHTILDLFMFAGIGWVAMRANRMYPLWLLAAQLIATLMHLERGVLQNMSPIAYWVMIRAPSYLQMVAFAIGLIAHRRRLKRGIVVRPWRRSLSR